MHSSETLLSLKLLCNAVFTPSLSQATLCGVLPLRIPLPRLISLACVAFLGSLRAIKVVRAYALCMCEKNTYTADPSAPTRVSTSTCLPSPTWIQSA